MYAITGATGHVGGAAARALLAAGERVRVIVRRPDAGAPWRDLGAEVAVADLTDDAALGASLRGADAVFAMLPTLPSASDGAHRVLAESIAEAVRTSGVDHVVMLSSYGAELPSGTGPIRWLHHMEQALGRSGATVTAIRSPHFQEKVADVLPGAVHEGVYPVFGSADVAIPMVATVDVGAAVAEEIRASAGASEVVDLVAPSYTEREVGERLGAALGRDLEVVEIPRPGWLDTLTGAGVPPALAAELVALYDAGEQGLLQPRGDRSRTCRTPIEATLRTLVRAVAPAP